MIIDEIIANHTNNRHVCNFVLGDGMRGHASIGASVGDDGILEILILVMEFMNHREDMLRIFCYEDA